MVLPLPKVIPDVGPGGGINTAMQGALGTGNALLKNQLLGQQAQYYPLTAAMTAVSNPLLWAAMKDNPSGQNAVYNLINNALAATTRGQGGGNSFLGTVVNKLGNIFGGTPTTPKQNGAGTSSDQDYGTNNGQSSGSQSAPNTSSGAIGSDNALNPAAGGIGSGVSGKMTAPYVQSPYGAGTTIATPTGVRSVPTSGVVDSAQTAISAIERVKPMMKAIIADSPKYLGSGEKGKVWLGSKINNLEQYFGNAWGAPDWALNKLGVNKEDISGYKSWQSNIANTADSVMKGMGLPLNETSTHLVTNVLTPVPGETGEGYAKRVQTQLTQLAEQEATQQNIISGGFNVTPNQQTNATYNPSLPGAATVQPNEPNKAEVQQEGVVPYVTIRNRKTGATMRISRDEARKMGVKGA